MQANSNTYCFGFVLLLILHHLAALAPLPVGCPCIMTYGSVSWWNTVLLDINCVLLYSLASRNAVTVTVLFSIQFEVVNTCNSKMNANSADLLHHSECVCTMITYSQVSIARVPTPPGKLWKVLDLFFKNFQDLESPGKSRLVLEGPGNYIV